MAPSSKRRHYNHTNREQCSHQSGEKVHGEGGGGGGGGGGRGADYPLDLVEDMGEVCIHCHEPSDTCQVRCDECQSFICPNCHWCHEYQANHEIRVCDRCDAFYCRNCDEMDQCDDCGEVVCASCSTLLSCKFCGGGLCEECATACGRCGIVLCSRDAKFAVDCDTCRLSYCLVCLASGSKDPCVRCGHRPSKRMEQLVHLRLKSIYKAFKQSSKSPKDNHPIASDFSHNNNHQHTMDHHLHRNESGPTIEELEEGMEDFRQESARVGAHYNDPYSQHHHPHHHNTNTHPRSHPHASCDGQQQPPQHLDERTIFEAAGTLEGKLLEEKRKEADAAAEALLAELQEEEEAAKTKTSKKKKKKVRHQQQQQQPHLQETPVMMKDSDENEELPETQQGSAVNEDDTKAQPTAPSIKKNKGKKKIQREEPMKNDDSSHDSRLKTSIPVAGPAPETPSLELKAPETDPFEKRLCDCVESDDADGIEDILFELKGVPGRASLRKNAKKALKRLRTPASDETEQPPETFTTTLDTQRTNGSVELLRLVSDKIVAGKQSSSSRAECVMQIAPVVVGWVIGKGGQRIRDLMEESGARIWIDQEKAQPEEPRSVYISGDRKAVDHAVYMVRDIVSKAPIEGADKYAPPEFKKPAAVVENPQEAVARPSPADGSFAPPGLYAREVPVGTMPAVPAGDLDTLLASTEPWSFLNSKGTHEKFEHVMTCEARFVPLLIGKRGWAIKDIQDKSGARVDIDQTMTPRQIRISGSKASVDKAIPMVRDVLNYPHAQPQNCGVLVDGDDQLLAADAVWNDDLDGSPVVTRGGERTPPPYSYITTGDAKSAISASSSLSSTPEPSVAPHKSLPPPFTSGPLITSGDYRLPQSAQIRPQIPPGGHYLPQDLPPRRISRVGDQGVYGNGGFMGMLPPPGVGVPIHHNVEHMYNQGPSPSLLHASHGHSFGMGPGMMPAQQQIGQYHQLHGSGPLGGGILSSGAISGGFDPNGGNRMMGGWNQGQSNAPSRGMPATGSGLPLASSNLGPTGFGNSTSFRPQSAPGPPIPAGSLSGFGAGQTAGVGRVPATSFDAGTADTPLQIGSLRDDSRLIDSLFGQTSKTSSVGGLTGTNIESAADLLPGLNSLHLGSTSAGPPITDGLWGDASLPSWNATTGIASSALNSSSNSTDPGLNQILAGLSPLDSNTDTQQHPHRSRFHWGSTNA